MALLLLISLFCRPITWPLFRLMVGGRPTGNLDALTIRHTYAA